ncbi:MAG: hypothetical protein RJA22_375 [Verrucomicrobiota bacterium]|jgi:SecD/SecF fusion protein
MQRKYFWQLVLVLIALAFSILSMVPPTSRDLVQEFKDRARNRDAAFTNILEVAQRMQATNATRIYGNLRDAIGTNNIAAYFPNINVSAVKNPTAHILNRLQRDAAGKIRLGLDLQGGTSFLLRMDVAQLGTNFDRGAALSHGVEVVRRRVDSLGLSEPVIQPAGEDAILVQLPGISESEKQRARELLQKSAFLEFRMVHPESDALVAADIIEPGYQRLDMETTRRVNGREVKGKETLMVKRGPERGLTGQYLSRAYLTRDQFSNKPEIGFELNDEGGRLFAEVTREWQPKGDRKYRLAIVLDGELYSAPVIQGVIPGGRGVIQGDFDVKEALDLVNVLQNPLQAPLRIEDERSVEPSLGRDSIRSGVVASVYGTIGVAAFMLLFYFFGGAVANLALLLNVVLTVGAMCAFSATFTLPGIAGLVLSIGMAVDANVLIFERIREELAAGKPLKAALQAGYSRAFGTILDSNLTTLISAVILAYLGTGPVKGFGVTLCIGVAASLFTALVVTRLIFEFLISRGILRSLSMLPVVKLTRIDFMAWTRPAFVLSALIIIGGVGYGTFVRGSKMMGVDFLGGDSISFEFKQAVGVDKLREAVGRLAIGDATIQYQKTIATGKETLQVLSAYNTGQKVEEALKREFPQAGFSVVGTDRVGPTVGTAIKASAIKACLLALFGILVYVAFRYEFSFAVAAVVATLHDVLFTLGVFALAGFELNATSVAAFLTIIGYSVNDKIVILDRIREDLKLGVHGSFRELINLALNQTLSRTLITGGSVILATLALYIFGGGVINDFAFTFLVGIVAGTYSSIFIACAVVLRWHKGQRPRIGSGVTVEAGTVRTTPAPAAGHA